MYLTERGLFPGYMPTPSTEHCAHVHNYTHIRDLTSFGGCCLKKEKEAQCAREPMRLAERQHNRRRLPVMLFRAATGRATIVDYPWLANSYPYLVGRVVACKWLHRPPSLPPAPFSFGYAMRDTRRRDRGLCGRCSRWLSQRPLISAAPAGSGVVVSALWLGKSAVSEDRSPRLNTPPSPARPLLPLPLPLPPSPSRALLHPTLLPGPEQV